MARLVGRRALLVGCLLAVVAGGAGGWLLLAQNARAVNTDVFGVAIDGYDPVAYFTLGRAVRGTSAFEHRWADATWRFASAEHRDRFAAEPLRYAPQYGGFCAAGLALGGKWRADPEVWAIVDGKLFLNYSQSGKDMLAADPKGVIHKADGAWSAQRPQD